MVSSEVTPQLPKWWGGGYQVIWLKIKLGPALGMMKTLLKPFTQTKIQQQQIGQKLPGLRLLYAGLHREGLQL